MTIFFGGLEAIAQHHMVAIDLIMDHNTYLESGSGPDRYPWATIPMGSGEPWSHVVSEPDGLRVPPHADSKRRK